MHPILLKSMTRRHGEPNMTPTRTYTTLDASAPATLGSSILDPINPIDSHHPWALNLMLYTISIQHKIIMELFDVSKDSSKSKISRLDPPNMDSNNPFKTLKEFN